MEQRAREYEQAARTSRRILFGEDADPTTSFANAASEAEEGRTASADAGARTPQEPPKEESVLEKFRDLLLYGPKRG
jgi:hypothetical protein